MSTIEWTEKTWNPVVGCTPVSSGCLNCYAAVMARRLEGMGVKEYAPREEELTAAQLREAHAAVGGGKLHEHERTKTVRIAEVRGEEGHTRAVFTGEVRCVPERLTIPLAWKKPRMIFVNSMSDLFHESVPFEFVDRVFAVMALCPQHTFQILTKRPERMAEYGSLRGHTGVGKIGIIDEIARRTGGADDGGVFYAAVERVKQWPLPNVWLGTSCENQAMADERVPWLMKCPGAVRFVSAEPLLGPVKLPLCHGNTDMAGIDWVIVGGESGANARACNVAWVQRIVKQCKGVGVSVFVKQLGANVIVRNDGCSEWLDECGLSLEYVEGTPQFQGDPVRVRLDDRKGGDMPQWPETVRVREFPRVARGGAS